MKNFMEEIIEKIKEKYDLSLFEEFDLIREDGVPVSSYPFRLYNGGLQHMFKDSNLETCWIDCPDFFYQFIKEAYGIKKHPFIPVKNGRYYYISWNNLDEEPYMTEEKWEGSIFDIYNLKAGNCFRIPEEAQRKKDEVYRRIMYDVGVVEE